VGVVWNWLTNFYGSTEVLHERIPSATNKPCFKEGLFIPVFHYHQYNLGVNKRALSAFASSCW